MTSTFVLFDLDGCLSDDRRRQPKLPPGGDGSGASIEAYRAYHEGIEADEPMNMDLVHDALCRGRKLLFITARPAEEEGATRRWLDRHFAAYGYTLMMRENGDLRGSPDMKCAALRKFFFHNPFAVIECAFDDREDVLEAYSAYDKVLKTVKLSYPRCDEDPEFTNESGFADGFRRAAEAHLAKTSGLMDLETRIAESAHMRTLLTSASRPISTTQGLLREMAETFEERNAIYDDNYEMVGPLMALFLPQGAPPELLHAPHFHLFELLIVKLSRFAKSNLSHADSIHDAAIYAAMIQTALENQDSTQQAASKND